MVVRIRIAQPKSSVNLTFSVIGPPIRRRQLFLCAVTFFHAWRSEEIMEISCPVVKLVLIVEFYSPIDDVAYSQTHLLSAARRCGVLRFKVSPWFTE